MKNVYQEELHRIISVVEIGSWCDFSLAGKNHGKLKKEVRSAFTPKNRKEYLIYNLQQQLYQHCYCHQIGAGFSEKIITSSRGDMTAFTLALSEANRSRDHWESEWHASNIENNGRLAAHKNELTLYLWPGQYHSPEPTVKIGLSIKVNMGKEYQELSPGFYMALSEAADNDKNEDQILRFYWNTSAEGAVILMSLVTTHLNEARLPFRFKTIKEPALYSRRDSSVLYIDKKDYDGVCEIVGKIYKELHEYFNSDVPLFTKQLAPGLGLSEDPGNGQSFGENRCRLIAEALWQAHQKKLKSFDRRLKEVVDHFDKNGISLEAPFLNPGSVDTYRFSCRTTGKNI